MEPQTHTVPQLWDKEEIKLDQNNIRKSLVSLDMQIHNNAVQCMLHAEKHLDTSLMRRLLLEIIGKKGSGYRVQGLIAWIRTYSPMELKGDVIKLSGVDSDGNRRPWRVDLADQAPFFTDVSFDEKEVALKPIFRETVADPINAAITKFRKALNNTVNGQPVDKTKPYYDGVQVDLMTQLVEEIEQKVVELSAFKDNTRAARRAASALKQAQMGVEECAA